MKTHQQVRLRVLTSCACSLPNPSTSQPFRIAFTDLINRLGAHGYEGAMGGGARLMVQVPVRVPPGKAAQARSVVIEIVRRGDVVEPTIQVYKDQ